MVDDNPPAYVDVDGHGRHYANVHSRSNANLPPRMPPSVDINGQGRHYANIHSRSNANVPSLPPHPPPSVDQVHIFEPKHNIHGTSCVTQELFSPRSYHHKTSQVPSTSTHLYQLWAKVNINQNDHYHTRLSVRATIRLSLISVRPAMFTRH